MGTIGKMDFFIDNATLVLITIGLVWAVAIVARSKRIGFPRGRLEVDLYRAARVIAGRNLSCEDAWEELYSDYVHIRKRHALARCMSLTSALEMLLTDYDLGKRHLPANAGLRDYWRDVLRVHKQRISNVDVPEEERKLLIALEEAIAAKDYSAAEEALRKLADEMERLNGNSIRETIRNNRALIVSIIGLLLTLVFGVFSILGSFSAGV